MKRLSRDFWIVAGLLVLLGVVTALAAVHQTQQATPPPLASFSDAPDGTHALSLWLGALGYSVSDDSTDPFGVPPDAKLAFLLEPTTSITPDEWRTLDKWVNDGGTLVLAGDGLGTALATAHYTVTLDYLTNTLPSLVAAAPVLASPPLASPAPARAQAALATDRRDVLPLLGAGPDAGAGAVPTGEMAALAFAQGKGRVVISAAPYALTNAGLKEAGNPELALNLISAAGLGAGAPSGGGKGLGTFGSGGAGTGTVWFDEWHHGIRPSAEAGIGGPEDWLRVTPAGHALLFVAALIFLALLLSGGRFGRPVPLPRDASRRAPLEYITAMANLQRRAGQRQAVLRHYHDQLKRRLGRRYRLDPALNDAEYVMRLAAVRPGLDSEALLKLLRELARPAVNEETLVRLADQAADLMKETH